MDAALLDKGTGPQTHQESAQPLALRPRLRIKLATPGSRGDIQPFVVLGQHLQRRGHYVTVCVEAAYTAVVKSWGLDAATLDGQNWVEDVDFVEQVAGKSMFQLATMVREREVAKGITQSGKLASYVPALQDADVIVSSFMSLSPTLAIAEKSHAAWALVLLTPGLAPSTEYPSIFIPIPRWFSCLNMATHNFGLRFLWRLNKGHVVPFRVQLGVSPITSALGDMADAEARMRSTQALEADNNKDHAQAATPVDWPLVLVAGTSLLSPTGRYASDWPAGYMGVGAFFAPPTPDDAISPVLQAFLADAAATSTPVVCIGFGSATCRPEALMRCALELASLPLRVIVLSGSTPVTATGTEAKPSKVLVLPSAPHDWLFPRMAAVVHSAGIGVLTACLRAGVPQVPCPFTTDQPSNAAMLVRQGVAPCVVRGGWKGIDMAALVGAVRAAALPGPPRDRLLIAAAGAGEIVRSESERALDRAADAIERQAACYRL